MLGMLTNLTSRRYHKYSTRCSSLTGFIMSVPGSQISPIEVDGGGRLQTKEDFEAIGILYPGERVDMVVAWGDNPPDHQPNLVISLDQE
jgi:hypothetical protein